MTTTDTTTKSSSPTLTRLQLEVLAGIRAGEVRRVKVGNTVDVVWYCEAGHPLDRGRAGGVVRTRRPNVTVAQLIKLRLARFDNEGRGSLTRAGDAAISRVRGVA